MIFDANLMFDMTYSAANGMGGVNVFTSGSSQVSTNVIDQLYARDLGQAKSGVAPVEIFVVVTTAFAGGTSLNIQLQGSTDNITYTTYAESGAIPLAALTLGANLFNVMIPGVQPESGPPPRYYRLNYVCVGAMTAGAVIAGLGATDDNRYYTPGTVVNN